MKVFFTASQRGKKEFGEYYKRIYNHLEKIGYQHVDPMIMDVNEKEFYKQLDEKGYERHEWLFANFVNQVKKTNIVVFELSLHSLSIGFMTEKALEIGRPVVILYLKGHLPYFLAGVNNEDLQLVEYTPANLEKKIEKAMNDARQLVTTRFNFFISKNMLNYLNKISKDNQISKSTFIRNLINEHKKKNEGNN